MKKETKLQQKCIEYLQSEGIYYINIHGGGWGAKGAPASSLIKGRFIALNSR